MSSSVYPKVQTLSCAFCLAVQRPGIRISGRELSRLWIRGLNPSLSRIPLGFWSGNVRRSSPGLLFSARRRRGEEEDERKMRRTSREECVSQQKGMTSSSFPPHSDQGFEPTTTSTPLFPPVVHFSLLPPFFVVFIFSSACK